MKIISDQQLQQLVDEARSVARLRKNLNLHSDLSDPVQRLCNAFEPGSYVRPHRHSQADKWELMVILKGEAIILLFDETATVTQRIVLSTRGPEYLLEVPQGAWHTVLTRESGTVLLEVKSGPYNKTEDKDFAQWAPVEGAPEAGQFVAWFERAQPGDKAPILPA
jgi:cupin fold WbuC family metalloprotein